MRFVDDDQMLVDMKHDFLDWKRSFTNDFAVVENFGTDAHWRIFMQWPTVMIQYPSALESILPSDTSNRRKTCAEGVQNRCPWTWNQLETTWSDTIDGRWGIHLHSIVMLEPRA